MRTRFPARTAALLLALGSCTPDDPQTRDRVAATPVAAPVAAIVPDAWTAFRDRFVATWFALDPAFAVYQGRHEHDGGLPDWSAAGLGRQAAFLHRSIAAAGRFEAAALSPDQRFERDYLVMVARDKLFWLEAADAPHRNPAWYVAGGLDPNVYVVRAYADPVRRMRALIALLRRIPAATLQIRANLATPMPISHIDYAANAFRGFASYYMDDSVKAFASVADEGLQRELADAAMTASEAMRDLALWVEAQRPSATRSFALGPALFAKMLRETEGVDTPIGTLEAAGRADLARNQRALAAACARFAFGLTVRDCLAQVNADKPVDGPVAEARRQIPMLRAFILRRDLLTLAGNEQALVEESPPYSRQNLAYIDPPGPFDRGVPSVYYISPPDPRWTPAVRDAFVPGKADLLFTSIHEAMPGHFVHFLHANRVPSLIGRVFVGYGYAEGWAHYAEEMMWEAGLGGGRADIHIGQLSNALLRDCRFLAAIGMHARGMSQAEAFTLFVDQCYQDEGNARQQALRGTYDPAYLNYTMGKLMIRRLRQDWTAGRGGRRAWKAFHDRLLRYGGPPIPLVRQAMLGEARPIAAF
ncbi:DUF885 domain-containing protein [Sphingomonas aerolata]|uniref:DUF885 domain-containing protein n=1 Tax=Sphingomonas aerolata TaxID=185951 RepID=UPI0035A73DFC